MNDRSPTPIDRPALIASLSRFTPARLRLAADGSPTPLEAVLDFQASHARAHDAIRRPADWQAVAAALAPLPHLAVRSRVPDRDTYLRRPDLGRALAPEAASVLAAAAPAAGCDAAIVLADGLSSRAVEAHGAPLAHALATRLAAEGIGLGPVVLAEQARVALGDDIGAALGARIVVVLIGERPGLSVSDSLGAYITHAPRTGTPDSARNCISNIHGNGGLSHREAALRLCWLVVQGLRRGVTGVALKDESEGYVRLERKNGD